MWSAYYMQVLRAEPRAFLRGLGLPRTPVRARLGVPLARQVRLSARARAQTDSIRKAVTAVTASAQVYASVLGVSAFPESTIERARVQYPHLVMTVPQSPRD